MPLSFFNNIFFFAKSTSVPQKPKSYRARILQEIPVQFQQTKFQLIF